MATPKLWIDFLGDRTTSAARPTVRVPGDPDERLELTPRARALIAVLAVPRELADATTWHPIELSVWGSQEIVERMGYVHRRAIQDALRDLKRLFAQHRLDFARYFRIDKASGQYGLDNVQVDFIELLMARDSPEHVDILLQNFTLLPATTALGSANDHLLSDAAKAQLKATLDAAAERWAEEPDPQRSEPPASEPPSGSMFEAEPERTTLEHSTSATRARPRADAPARRVPRVIVAGVVAVILFAAGNYLLAHRGEDSSTGSGSTVPLTSTETAAARTRPEIAGGLLRTWTDYTIAGGGSGKSIPPGATVQIRCKVRGFEVENGNPWWYRIASPPWSDRFYATADGFYNNGQSSGKLRGTPYVDPNVPNCP